VEGCGGGKGEAVGEDDAEAEAGGSWVLPFVSPFLVLVSGVFPVSSFPFADQDSLLLFLQETSPTSPSRRSWMPTNILNIFSFGAATISLRIIHDVEVSRYVLLEFSHGLFPASC
jgi:hypothetical protein